MSRVRDIAGAVVMWITAVHVTVVWFACVVGLGRVFKERSNCANYAVRKCWEEGGYVVLVHSEYGVWPHLIHVDLDGVATEYSPVTPKRPRVFPPIVFKGIVRKVPSLTVVVNTRSKQ